MVFLAPTKPLVAQQAAACQAFMGSSKVLIASGPLPSSMMCRPLIAGICLPC